MQTSPLIHINNLHIVLPAAPSASLEAFAAELGKASERHICLIVGKDMPEQGGILAGVMPAQNGHPAYGLIVPTASEAEAENLAWGTYGTIVEGATSSWDGKANSAALLKDGDHPAAAFCSTLKIGDHADFYLASRREFALMSAAVPHLFKPEGWYWTSTQYGASDAHVQVFKDGSQLISNKDDPRRVRAVRRFIID